MAAKPPDAFLSYTRFNDQHDGGAISEFCRKLASAVQAVTGVPFDIFQDVEGIGIGEHWPGKLDRMLDQARFFIPILTPSYFTSKACRDELAKFLHAEAERGRYDLVLPIYYIECDLLEDEDLRCADPLASTIYERQRQDWRELRYEPFDAREVRKELERLARQIVRARRQVMSLESATSSAEPTPPAGLTDERSTVVRRSTQHLLEVEDALAMSDSVARSGQRTLEPGKVFRDIDAPWCPEMVVIPPGEFMMGSAESEKERPQHVVRIAYPLAVGRYPVTFEEYDHFVRSKGRAQPGDEGWGRGRRPVINVDWEDAKAFAAWLSVQTGQRYRLLSEAEWEYACRGGTTTRSWWGDQITPENANYGRNVDGTSEVGSYHANPFGLYDMQGNVWEWVEDRWHNSYDGAPDDGSAWTAGSDSRRVVRGGSWGNSQGVLRSTVRVRYDTAYRGAGVGFRVARTLTVQPAAGP